MMVPQVTTCYNPFMMILGIVYGIVFATNGSHCAHPVLLLQLCQLRLLQLLLAGDHLLFLRDEATWWILCRYSFIKPNLSYVEIIQRNTWYSNISGVACGEATKTTTWQPTKARSARGWNPNNRRAVPSPLSLFFRSEIFSSRSNIFSFSIFS